MPLHSGNQISLDITGRHQMEDADKNSKSLVLITRVGSTPTTGIRSSLESNDSGLLFFFQKTLHRNRLGTLYCHEGDWSWIYFFNGQCADAAGTALWQWLGQQRR